jgi:hypothetical protein
LDCRVRLLAAPAAIGAGRMRNLSVTGAFIETDLDLRRLSLLYVQPEGSALAKSRFFWMIASVTRQGAGGIGLEWSHPLVAPARFAALQSFFEHGERGAFTGPVQLLGAEEIQVLAMHEPNPPTGTLYE